MAWQSRLQRRGTATGQRLQGPGHLFLLLALLVLLSPQLLVIVNARSNQRDGAATFAAVESFMTGNQQQQQPLMAAAYSYQLSNVVSTGEEENDQARKLIADDHRPANRSRSVKGRVTLKTLLQERWGHTSAYLPTENVVIFTGGQISGANGTEAVTNDVFALDMTNVTSKSTESEILKRWARLSSKKLQPHAFAARAVTHSGSHKGQHLFIVGGATADCSSDSAPVYLWTSGENGSWKDGQWYAPTVAEGQTLPPRRRGAMAVQVPVAIGLNSTEAERANERGGVAFMVLGGYLDYTTCNTSNVPNLDRPAEYPMVDIWTIGAGKKGVEKRNTFDAQSDTLTVRTLPLDPRMPNMSVIDYSTVVLPANKTAKENARIVYVGGRDAYGQFTPMNQLWALDVQTSKWQRLQTTNGTGSGLDIPLGRMGHSSTLMDDGRILIHGGYVTLDKDQIASNDSYLLDPRVNPAVWHKISPSDDSGVDVGFSAPNRAYHSAIVAHGILVVGFGQMGTGTMAASDGVYSDASSDSTRALATSKMGTASHAPLHYLAPSGQGRWTWTTSLDSAFLAREGKGEKSDAQVTLSSEAGSNTSNSDAATKEEPQSQEQKVDSTPNSDGDAAKGQLSTSSQNQDVNSDAVPDDGDADAGASPPKKHTTAVVASVLGAAALAATLGGLYFARKRRMSSDTSTIGDDDKYQRFTSSPSNPAPPVSSLWINQPMAWANTAGKGLKRHASMASEAFLARTRSMRTIREPEQEGVGRTSAVVMMNAGPQMRQGWRAMSSPVANRTYSVDARNEQYTGGEDASTGVFQVLRKMPSTSRFSIRRSERQRQEDIRARLSAQEANFAANEDDEAMVDVALGGEKGLAPLPDDFIRTLLHDDEFDHGDGDELAEKPGKSSVRRYRSSESIVSSSSVDGASHFSYPYLSAMHNPSMDRDYQQSLSPTSSKQVGLTGPDESPYSVDDEGRADATRANARFAISPRQALLRASLTRSPGSQPLYNMARGALASTSPAVDLFWGKNAQLNKKLSSSRPIEFSDPFADTHAADSAHDAADHSNAPTPTIDQTTELDFRTTVLGGETGRERPTDSPTMSLALFPWETNDGAGSQPLASPLPWSASPTASMRSPRAPLTPMQRLPMYQQPILGGVRLPIHPVLLDAAAAHQSPLRSNRRARPSLLRVTNQADS